MHPSEIHVEQILGRRVHDAENRVVGRLEELCVEVVDGEYVVTEFLIGPEAVLERIGGFLIQLPLFNLIRVHRRDHRVPWKLMDFADPHTPRIRVRRDELPRP